MSKILVVDDDQMNLKMAGFMLGQNNHEIITALSGLEAVEFLTQNEVDLVLLDIEMPNMDGFETFRQIRQNPDIQDVPVIFLSASTEEEVIKKALDEGAIDYIKKPFIPADFNAQIEHALR